MSAKIKIAKPSPLLSGEVLYQGEAECKDCDIEFTLTDQHLFAHDSKYQCGTVCPRCQEIVKSKACLYDFCTLFWKEMKKRDSDSVIPFLGSMVITREAKYHDRPMLLKMVCDGCHAELHVPEAQIVLTDNTREHFNITCPSCSTRNFESCEEYDIRKYVQDRLLVEPRERCSCLIM